VFVYSPGHECLPAALHVERHVSISIPLTYPCICCHRLRLLRSERLLKDGYPYLVLQREPRQVVVKAARAVLVLARGEAPPQLPCVLHKDKVPQQAHGVTATYSAGEVPAVWRPRPQRCGSRMCVSPLCLFFNKQVGGRAPRWGACCHA
jgi:hypothetical protein